MIIFLEGILTEKTPARLALNVAGVGYEVFIPLRSYDRLPAEQQPCRILIYDYVREDQHVLYGFITEEERQLFVLLMGVSGIGPKLAMSALSSLSANELSIAISSSDVQRLSAISGIGKKIAERMVVELRDKVSGALALTAAASALDATPGNQRARDAIMALIALGYKQAQAQKMIAAAIPRLAADAAIEEIVRQALLH